MTFYQRTDVLQVAKDLLGKMILTNIHGEGLTGGIITETEAYGGITDRASHAFGNRKTARTCPMFEAGGITYIYLCYGIHHLLNIVTNVSGVPHAVLIRGIYPLVGLEIIKKRRRYSHALEIYKNLNFLTNGPGKVAQALGLNLQHNSLSLQGNKIWIENKSLNIEPTKILSGPRIGVDYAGPDAHLPWRFFLDPEILSNLFLVGQFPRVRVTSCNW